MIMQRIILRIIQSGGGSVVVDLLFQKVTLYNCKNRCQISLKSYC